MARVLIVQDSPPNGLQLRLARETQVDQLRQDLESEGFDVDVCLDASAAVSTFANAKYDLAVLDLTMPGLSGFELCQQLKASANGADVPVLLVLSPTDPAHMVRAIESAADSLITAPYEREHLAARTQALMHAHRSRGERPHPDAETDLAAYKAAAQADKTRVLSFLLATFDDLVRTHHELLKCQGELANAQQVGQSFAHELERRVRERTNELMERQELLHQAR